MSAKISQERRKSNERRTSIQGDQFPIITRGGKCLPDDRREQPERRISKIEVVLNSLKEDAFKLLFQNLQTKNNPSRVTTSQISKHFKSHLFSSIFVRCFLVLL